MSAASQCASECGRTVRNETVRNEYWVIQICSVGSSTHTVKLTVFRKMLKWVVIKTSTCDGSSGLFFRFALQNCL